MAQQLIPNTYRYNSAQNFVDSFNKTGANGNYYYVFAGNHQPYNNSVIPTIYDNVNQTYIDVYRNMIFGKLAKTTDVSLVIKKYQWISGSVYSMYDDQDINLSSEIFYVYVFGGSYYHVFKCLDNNSGAVSTVQPDFLAIGSDGVYTSPTDGYTWKYMYSFDSSSYDQFATDTYIPYTANVEVINSAVSGSIEAVKIISTGSGYNNYIVNGYFSTSDIGVYQNAYNYAISVGGASQVDDYYKGCVVAITSGTGRGQYRNINIYNGSTATKFMTLNAPFNPNPDNTSTYSIYPGVYITGDQTQSVNAVAWAYVNPNGNTISRIEMLSKGQDYKIANAEVYASQYVNPTSIATVRPILSPPGGHGSNPANELYCSASEISVKFRNSESNTIPSSSYYRQIGVLLNPQYSSVVVKYSSSRGTFIGNETVYSFYPKRIQQNVNISSGNNVMVAANNGSFDTLLTANTLIYVSTGTVDQLFVVGGVTNSTYATLNLQSPYTFANATVYTLDTQAYGTIDSVTTGQIEIKNLIGHIKTDTLLVGSSSGAVANVISDIVINGVSKQFDTFVEAYRYTGTTTTGTFQINETVTQISNIVSSAILHSVQNINGVTNYFVTNQNGIFNTSNTIVGLNSGAVATLTNKYLPEVVFGSGKILYLENLAQITRANNQSEQYQLIFEF